MATLSTAIDLQNRMSPQLDVITGSLRTTIATMRILNNELVAGPQQDMYGAALTNLRRLQRQLNEIRKEISEIPPEQEQVTQGFSDWQRGVISVSAALNVLGRIWDSIKRFANITDEFTSTTARVNMINDGLRTELELQQAIFDSAQRSGSLYATTADTVAKLNLLARDAFSGNDEALAFAEVLQKAFFVSGVGLQEQNAATRQMIQALASGRLQGDEFISITENAPLIAQAIADTVGTSMGEMRKLSREGLITTDIVKKAVFSVADDINDKFMQIPQTFGQTMNSIRNQALWTSRELLMSFSNFLNSPAFSVWYQRIISLVVSIGSYLLQLGDWFGRLMRNQGFQTFLSDMAIFFTVLGSIVMATIGFIQTTIDVLALLWPYIGPTLMSLLYFFLEITIALKAYALWMAITRGVTFLAAAAMIVYGVATGTMTAATVAATAAQLGLNAAIWANPITWMIVVVLALIAVLVALGAAVVRLWNTNVAFREGIFAVWNTILDFFNRIPLAFVQVGMGIQNVFSWIRQGVFSLMEGMVNGIINRINTLIGWLNKIPGVNVSAMEQVSFGAERAIQEEAIRQSNREVVDAAALEYVENRDARLAQQAESLAEMSNRLQVEYDALNAPTDFQGRITRDLEIPFDYKDYFDRATIAGGFLDSVGEVGIKKEDLKYLRDAARVDYINQYTTLRPVVTASFGDVRETADVEQILGVFENGVEESMRNVLWRGVRPLEN